MTPSTETLIRHAYFMPGSSADIAGQMNCLGIATTEEEVLDVWAALALFDPEFCQARPEFGFSAERPEIITLAERIFG